jgi:hypothetical protein
VEKDSRLLIAGVAISTLICGCATTQEVVMRNASGQERYCYWEHNYTLSDVGSKDAFNKCINDAGAEGFKKVN